MTEILKNFFSVKDVATHLGMSAHFIYQEIKSGALEHYVLGGSVRKKGRIRISGEQLQSYLDKQINQRKNCVVHMMPTGAEHYAMAQHNVSHGLNKLLEKKDKRRVK